jgi:hypothetical protein
MGHVGVHVSRCVGLVRQGGCGLRSGKESEMGPEVDGGTQGDRTGSGEGVCDRTLTTSLWAKTGREWREPGLGLIIGCGLAEYRTNRKPHKGDNRLSRILISELERLIWAIQCQSMIPKESKQQTKQEIHARWRKMLQEQLDFDRAMTIEKRFGKKAIKPTIVESTWNKIVEQSKNPSYDWVKMGRVLVGTKQTEEECDNE